MNRGRTMDPDANLEAQRRISERFIAGSLSIEDANKLAELVLALDKWIKAGGFLPNSWKAQIMKADRFILTLDLGNDAMRFWADISRALRQVADSVDGGSEEDVLSGDSNSIRDTNGNRVGNWKTIHRQGE